MSIEKVLEAVAPKTNWFVVLRPFSGDSGQLGAGEVVDTANWSHTKVLQDNRYITPLPYGVAVPDLVIGSDGIERRILTENSAPSENLSERPTPIRKKQ